MASIPVAGWIGIGIGAVFLIVGADKAIKYLFDTQVQGSTSEGTEDEQKGGRRSRRQRKGGTKRRELRKS